MADRTTCIRCQRQIDRFAKSCVFCNWDQSEPVPPQPEQAAAPLYVPPPDNRARNRVLGIAGSVVLVITAFVVGTWVHGKDIKAPPGKNVPVIAENASQPQRSHVTLVPVSEGPSLPLLEQPITSAPPAAPGQQPGDATALPSDQYTAVAEKAKAMKKAAATSIDPRTLRGRAFQEEPTLPPPMASSQSQDSLSPRLEHREPAPARTEALPQYQPLPSFSVDRETTAHLTLTVGPDGHVKDIDVDDTIPGETARLVGAIQNWRFKPATENGIPVTSRVSVKITLHPHE